jgi:hypothetical protein
LTEIRASLRLVTLLNNSTWLFFKSAENCIISSGLNLVNNANAVDQEAVSGRFTSFSNVETKGAILVSLIQVLSRFTSSKHCSSAEL